MATQPMLARESGGGFAGSLGGPDLNHMVRQAGARKQRVPVTRRGKAVAYMVPPEDVQALEYLEDQLDGMECERLLQDIQAGRQTPIPWDEVKKQL
ncbi:MAG: prevent-host-death family protein [Myxococcota bacterium]